MTAETWAILAVSLGVVVGVVCYCWGYASAQTPGPGKARCYDKYTTVTTTTYCCPLREQQEDKTHDRGHV